MKSIHTQKGALSTSSRKGDTWVSGSQCVCVSGGGCSLQVKPGVLGNERPVSAGAGAGAGAGAVSYLAGRGAGPSPEGALEFQKESHSFSM